MKRNASTGLAGLSAAVAVLAGVASALGVFARGDGTFVPGTSARGEIYEVATTGIYADNARQLVAEGVGWDVRDRAERSGGRASHPAAAPTARQAGRP